MVGVGMIVPGDVVTCASSWRDTKLWDLEFKHAIHGRLRSGQIGLVVAVTFADCLVMAPDGLGWAHATLLEIL